MDPQIYARRRITQTEPELAWRPQSRAQMRAWQRRLRTRLNRLLGDLRSWERPPLHATIEETRDFGRYRRETIRFDSRPGLSVFGYFLVPTDPPMHQPAGDARPAILCLPGHGRGVDSIVGIAENGEQREPDAPDEYQADFALACVARGYPTLAIEQISFGHRRDARAAATGNPGASSCTRDSMAALMLGETITGWRVWDALRALDYLQTRVEVDPKRLAVMGISGGGLTALWSACLDTRVRAAVVSGYFNTWADSILAVDHCVDNYVPGLLSVVGMPDLAGLVAPRALFVEGGTEDTIFPRPAFERATARAREIYAAFGVSERFGSEAFAGGHRFHGTGAFRFLEERLCPEARGETRR